MRLRLLLATTTLLLASSVVSSADELSAGSDGAGAPSSCERITEGVEEVKPSEPTGVGAGLVLDEHLLTDAKRDEDYNGGGEVTLSGQRAGLLGRLLDRALGFINEKTCPRARFDAPGWSTAHAFAAGLLVFTPRDLRAHGVDYGDRPYASEFFLSTGRRYASTDADVVYDSSLTVGMLGLPAAESVQRALHDVTGSIQPEGWSHQISAGGEPTARYSFARQALLAEYGEGAWHGDSKWTAAGSVGTVTEGSLALNARWGRVESPWWAFAPEENTYVQETQPVAPSLGLDAPSEVFVFAGARAKLRAYNAFLQGQLRHSDLTYAEGSLNQVLGEAWAGLEWRSSSGWAVQYLARWESPELRSGIGARSIVWGSIEISKSFR
jgi:Uncharacterized protein conserved in bacteria (DUF2219)